MAHNSLIRNPVTNWTNGSTVLRLELVSFDLALAAAVNGDDGGCWAPANPFVIGGNGLSVVGPLTIVRGGQLQANTPGSIQFTGASFYPTYAAGHVGTTRTMVSPCAKAVPVQKQGWMVRWSDAGVQSIAPTLDMSDGNGPLPAKMIVPIRPHGGPGSTMSTLSVNFRVGWAHTSLPTAMPKARVLRVDSSGNAVTLTSQAAGADANGFVQAKRPSNAAQWTGSQSIAITCDQNNAINIASYQYYVEIWDEQWTSGSPYPWQLVVKQSVQAVLLKANPELHGTITCDGYTPNVGDRVLVVGSGAATCQTGIWIVGKGVWSRASDWNTASSFSQGMLIPVDRGNVFGGSLWQTSSTTATWSPGVASSSIAGAGGGSPGSLDFWQPTYVWPVGTPALYTGIVPSAGNGFWYTGTSGTTAGSEPNWPTDIGAQVTDGTVTWTCVGPTATANLQMVVRGVDDNETPNNQGTELLPHGNIFQTISATFTGITGYGQT